MKKLLWTLIFSCLTLVLVYPAGAGKTDRMCYDFDARVARVKERISWYEKTLYDDLTSLRQDKAQTQGIPQLASADEKLGLAIRLCNDALSEVRILRDRVPREIECGDKHHRVRQQMEVEVQALNDVEAKISGLNVITNQYRSLRLEAAAFMEGTERRPRR